MAEYHSGVIADYFDQLADGEWERLVKTPTAEIRLEVHAHYLRSFILPGSRVLEVGAGPGRFTQMLAALGCRITVVDISQVQLDLNRRYADELGFETAVAGWLQMDICDLTEFAADSFDALVCYGGPLSYVLDRREQALAECARATRPGGLIFMSVMSLWGSAHEHLPAVLTTPVENNRQIVATGDLTPQTRPGSRHDCHMFRAAELRRFLEGQGLEVAAMSASNTLTTGWDEPLTEVRQDPERWAELLAMEIEACCEAGCLDMGSHIIAVARKKF